jgi:hypothetical protein
MHTVTTATHPAPLQSFKLARLARYKAGQTILDGDASHSTLMLLVEGLAAYRVTERKAPCRKSSSSLQGITGQLAGSVPSQKVT